MTGYIPPGPQQPFDKYRAYGQEPGFVSRHTGKLIVAGLLLLVLVTIALYLASPFDDDSNRELETNASSSPFPN